MLPDDNADEAPAITSDLITTRARQLQRRQDEFENTIRDYDFGPGIWPVSESRA